MIACTFCSTSQSLRGITVMLITLNCWNLIIWWGDCYVHEHNVGKISLLKFQAIAKKVEKNLRGYILLHPMYIFSNTPASRFQYPLKENIQGNRLSVPQVRQIVTNLRSIIATVHFKMKCYVQSIIVYTVAGPNRDARRNISHWMI